MAQVKARNTAWRYEDLPLFCNASVSARFNKLLLLLLSTIN